MINRKKRMGLIAAAAAASLVVMSPGTVLAASATIEGAGSTEEGTPAYTFSGTVYGGTNNVIGSTQINVNAKTISDTDIVYNITIEYGEMQFDYHYGGTWDPVTHSYGGGSQTAGWDVTQVAGTNSDGNIINNGIRITNDSNFPVMAEFSYDTTGQQQLNTNSSAAGSVVGMFGYDNTELVPLLSLGKGNTQVENLATLTAAVEMDHSQLVSGQHYYYKNLKNGNNYQDIYFALSGTPNTVVSSYGIVGAITVTISPARNTIKETIS